MTRQPEQLHLRHIGPSEANAFIAAVHCHHGPVRHHKFALAAEDSNGVVRGVAIAGRPVARLFDTGWHLEVLRVTTDGTPNACSLLYAAVARAGAAIGYRRQDILTYTLGTEAGTSLRAAGWIPMATTAGVGWKRPTRRRTDGRLTTGKIRWHAAPPTVAAVAKDAER